MFCVRTDGGAADDAVVDRRRAVLRHLQRVVLVVRHRRVRLRRELQVQPRETVTLQVQPRETISDTNQMTVKSRL